MSDARVMISAPLPRRATWLVAVLPVLAVLSLGLRPISNPDFWWQLSRGRAVLEGQVSPSRILLAGDALAEADWLGGVPFYLIYRMAGISGLMWFKLSVFGCLAVYSWRLTSVAPSDWSGAEATPIGGASIARRAIILKALILAALMSVIVTACDPTPILWDVLGLVVAASILSQIRNRIGWRGLFGWFSVSVVWANCGPLSILILLPLCTEWLGCFHPISGSRGSSKNPDAHFNQAPKESGGDQGATEAAPPRSDSSAPMSCGKGLTLLCVAMVGLCLTPRGIMTPWDSIRLLVPLLVVSREILQETDWRPIWIGPIDSVVVGWGVLSLIGVLGCIGGMCRGVGRWSAILLPISVLSLACWSRLNAIVLSVWLMRWAFEQSSNWTAQKMRYAQTRRYVRWAMIGAGQGLCLLVALHSVVGHWPFEGNRIGWGLNRRLEIRMLIDSLEPKLATWNAAPPPPGLMGTAHCTDIRSAGMLAWSKRSRANPYLIPQRALLNGRLRDEVLLNRELESGWLKYHRRSDGTGGGWWLTLRERGTQLLLTSNEHITLIRSLEPTIWKPLSIDSPVIAYALAGYPTFTTGIAKVAQDRDLVDRGPWSFNPEPPAGNDQLIDGLGFVLGWPNPDPVLRQAAVFRAMNLPQAAMRVLRPLLRSGPVEGWASQSRLRHELLACQFELAERERLSSGQIVEFRRHVLKSLAPQFAVEDFSEGVRADKHPEATIPWTAAVALYLAGDPDQSADLLQGDDPAIMQARAMLKWEAGDVAQAREIWTALKRHHPASREALASRYALESENY